MIRPQYALRLALTKLRSKRLVLLATICASSLLFAVLIAAIIVFGAAEKSTGALVRAANNNQYLVKVQPVIRGGVVAGMDPIHLTAENIKTIRTYEADYYKTLKARYAKLGIDYIDPNPDDSLLIPNAFADPITPTELRYRLNFSSPLMDRFEQIQFLSYVRTARNTLDELKKTASKYNGNGYYSVGNALLPTIPNQLLILNGRENFGDITVKAGDMGTYGYSTNAIHNGMYELQDQQLVSRYITSTSIEKLKGIPVIVTAQEAVALFGKDNNIGDEPKDGQAKRTWLDKVKQKLTDYTYQTCYRNQPEQTMLAKIQQDYADTELHKDDKNYSAPTLIYNYPPTPCGDITVKSDTRSQAEKDAAARNIDEQKKLGTYIAPAHYTITYQIVGFINAEPYSDANQDASSYLKNLLSYHLDLMSGIVPSQMYATLPHDMQPAITQLLPGGAEYTAARQALAPHVVAFPSINEARDFMNNETCPLNDTNCEKLYTADPYGSNYLILDEIGKMFKQFMVYALPTITVLAALIVWFMMSRVMSDNRKETAVYRAMGARRIDIAAIYMTYTIIIASLIASTSLLVGIFAAFVINHTYGVILASTASIAFGVGGNNTNALTLFDVSSPLLVYVYVAIIALCIIAVLQPLLRNALRPPIRDIREE